MFLSTIKLDLSLYVTYRCISFLNYALPGLNREQWNAADTSRNRDVTLSFLSSPRNSYNDSLSPEYTIYVSELYKAGSTI